MFGLDDPAADTSGNRIARSHPWGGCTTYFPLFLLFFGLGPFPSILSRYGWVLGPSLSSFFCFLILLQPFTISPLLDLDWLEVARLLPAPSLPPTPLLYSVTVASQMFLPLLPSGGGLTGVLDGG